VRKGQGAWDRWRASVGGVLSFAYLPFYTGDYFRDTRGLSMAGHGCYFLLLTYCWDSQGPLPLDDERIAGICEARSQEERNTMGRILATYFVRMDDGWYNERMQREIERCNAISTTRTEAGRRGANERMRRMRDIQANAKQVLSKSQASAKQVTLTSSPSPTSSSKIKGNVGLAPDATQSGLQGKALRDAAKRVLETLNRNAGRKYEPVDANINPILARFREGYTEQELRAIAAVKARQWKGDEKMEQYIRPKTLYNATNAAQYRAELPASQLEEETE